MIRVGFEKIDNEKVIIIIVFSDREVELFRYLKSCYGEKLINVLRSEIEKVIESLTYKCYRARSIK